MPVAWIGDARVYADRMRAGVQRPYIWAGRREKCWYYQVASLYVRVCYRPFQGMSLESVVLIVDGVNKGETSFPSLRNQAMKKVALNIDEKAPLPSLSVESKTFAKFPCFRDFMTARSYADGQLRSTGRIWLDSDGTAFTLTLFERTAAAKMRVRAETLDDVFMLAERHLASDNPPWESDEYEAERQRGIARLKDEKKRKRK